LQLPTPNGYYHSDDAFLLTNNEKLPIILLNACKTCKFDLNENSLGWSFISNSDGGAIGVFGSTGTSYGYAGEFITEGLHGKIILDVFKAYENKEAISIGEMWTKSISNYIFPNMEDNDYKTIEEFQYFGDPTIQLTKSNKPEKPNKIEGPNKGNINIEYTYRVFTTDADDDQIFYLFDWGDGEYSGWIGPFDSGKSVEASHIWTSKGNYDIRVRARDIHGMISDWSDPLSISMPKSYRFIKPFLDLFSFYQETFSISLKYIFNI
jgi:hypothetical protein